MSEVDDLKEKIAGRRKMLADLRAKWPRYDWSERQRYLKAELEKASGRTFYDTGEWQHVRYKALKRGKGCCECCGATPTARNPLQVDHIKPRSKYPELSLVLSNLQVLCKDCNMGKSASDETDWRRVT
jgi:5-methylcytosine-specific restriction endonuclease McrA